MTNQRIAPALLVWGPLLASLIWAALVFNPATYEWALGRFRYMREYTFVEVGTVMGFAVATIAGAYCAFQHYRRGSSWLTLVFFSGFTLAAFLVAMEEVQWAQPLLGYDIPDFIAATNAQDEMTFHNHEGLQSREGWFYLAFCVGAFALFLPRLWPFPQDVWSQWRARKDLRAIVWIVLLISFMKLYDLYVGNPFAPLKPIRWTTEIGEGLIAYWSAAFASLKAIELFKDEPLAPPSM
ncbi:MAG: hypothetical protein AAF291_01520 [Pseudomonadota bacterium]